MRFENQSRNLQISTYISNKFFLFSGAQSNGCKYNKKPQYRYSGCHGYDESAFNIILGLEFGFDETKFSMHDEPNLFYTETLEQATKFLENRRKNISDTSEHPFTEE
jgi:hypothetical protein